MNEPEVKAPTAHEQFLEAIKDHKVAPGHVIRDAMKEKGVETASELHPLFGARVTYDGAPGTIDYAVGTRFRCTLDGEPRQPWGDIADLKVDGDHSYSYTTPKTEG
jgi:hypothetical protein